MAKESAGWLVIDQAGGLSNIDKSVINEVAVFPNPATDFITLKNAKNKKHIEIYDVYGILVKSEKYSWRINLSSDCIG